MATTPRSADAFESVLKRRLTRRRLLVRGSELAAATCVVELARTGAAAASDSGFEPIAPSAADAVIVPEGFRSTVVLRWGDPLFPGVPALDPTAVAAGALLEPGAARAQARQFGFNCDGLGLFPVGPERLVVCVNHEFPSPDLLFPGWGEARRTQTRGRFVERNAEAVPYMQAAVGISIVELRRERAWRFEAGSPFNRRLTAHSRMELAGPARSHPLFRPTGGRPPLIALGTLGNCAAGSTPWGTYLTAEENTDDYFGNTAAAQLPAALGRAYERFGTRSGDSAYRWEYTDPRFDVAANPHESLKFGWIVEIDPFDAGRPIKKRTALGRFKHEGATTVLTGDGRAAAYMGDDEVFEYFYKFVSRDVVDLDDRSRNRDLLDEGVLHVARFFDDGRGEWVPLVWNEHPELGERHGFRSQGDVVIRCREAADRAGATPLDRPEDVAVDPRTGRVYLACTRNTTRGDAGAPGADAVNPRAPNPHGHIIELIEDRDDAGSTTFRWELLILAGDPARSGLRTTPVTAGSQLRSEETYYAGAADPDDLAPFASPDNLGFDSSGNLWIVTDGAQPRGTNDGCFVCPTSGPLRGAVKQFMSGPVGAEICGCELTADDRTLFLTIQHPGAGGSVTAPVSRWPDGGSAVSRPSLIAIDALEADRTLGY
jgi:uncharacterized protein